MNHTPKTVDLDTVLSTCAWCHKKIASDQEVYSLGAYVKEGVEMQALEGRPIELFLPVSGRRVYALVPVRDSTARAAGSDLLFLVCSQGCGEALTEALQQELDFSTSQ
jgi:hypothetical protein